MPELVRGPSFLLGLRGHDSDTRKKLLEQVHHDYGARSEGWQVLLDAFEGDGGFADGSYLWEYPREDTKDYLDRQAQARYHNHAESIADVYIRHVFGAVSRTCTNKDYLAWCDNVDGHGLTLNDVLKRFASVALVCGHAGLLVDRTADVPMGPTKADDPGRVLPQVFTATAIVDWRYRADRLVGVKLQEAGRSDDLLRDRSAAAEDLTWLLWAEDGWARFDAEGNFLGADTPDLGTVPFVVLRPKPSYRSQMVGRGILGNANVVRALYNRASEEDEVLRKQAFSVLTVSVGPDGDVQQTREQLTATIGASKALVAKGTIDYKTPSQEAPKTIRDNINFLIRELYRGAHVRLPKDSAQVETAEAIKLQHDELNEELKALGAALAQAEKDIARLWCLWEAPSRDAGLALFERMEFSAQYPKEFFLESVLTELDEVSEGVALNLGKTMTGRLKMRAVHRLDPGIDEPTLKTIEAEIAEGIEKDAALLELGPDPDDMEDDPDNPGQMRKKAAA